MPKRKGWFYRPKKKGESLSSDAREGGVPAGDLMAVKGAAPPGYKRVKAKTVAKQFGKVKLTRPPKKRRARSRARKVVR